MSRCLALVLVCALASSVDAAFITVNTPPDQSNFFPVNATLADPAGTLSGPGVRGISDFDALNGTAGWIEWSIQNPSDPPNRVPATLYVPLVDEGFRFMDRRPVTEPRAWVNVDLSEFIAAGDASVSFLIGDQFPGTQQTFQITSPHLGVVSRTFTITDTLPEPSAVALALACCLPLGMVRRRH
jgi:hypothetical protein